LFDEIIIGIAPHFSSLLTLVFYRYHDLVGLMDQVESADEDRVGSAKDKIREIDA
jgi:hypothetical protein